MKIDERQGNLGEFLSKRTFDCPLNVFVDLNYVQPVEDKKPRVTTVKSFRRAVEHWRSPMPFFKKNHSNEFFFRVFTVERSNSKKYEKVRSSMDKCRSLKRHES